MSHLKYDRILTVLISSEHRNAEENCSCGISSEGSAQLNRPHEVILIRVVALKAVVGFALCK